MNTYSPKIAEKMKGVASNAMDLADQKIEQLNKMSSESRKRSTEYLISWQKWLATISFSLSAIGAAILAQGQIASLSVLMSLALFLMLGIWIMIEHKRQLEKAASSGSAEVDEMRPLYDDKKKAAFMMWEDPSNIQKHKEFLETELRIMEKSKHLLGSLEEEYSQGRVIYLNDIWLGMVIAAIYFLFWPVIGSLNLELGHLGVPILYASVWVGLMNVVIIDAVKSREYIAKANISKQKKFDSEKRHTEEYTDEVKRRVEQADSLLKQP